MDYTDEKDFSRYLTSELAPDMHEAGNRLTAADVDRAGLTIMRLANRILELEAKAHTADVMAVWEWYMEGDVDYIDAKLAKLPTEGYGDHREYVANTITPFCDKWYRYMHDFMGYDYYNYDWDFVPVFLGSLPTHDVDDITLADISKALLAVWDNVDPRFYRTAS